MHFVCFKAAIVNLGPDYNLGFASTAGCLAVAFCYLGSLIAFDEFLPY